MVRLMLTLTPIVCVCGGIVVSEVLTTYLDIRTPGPKTLDTTNSGTDASKGKKVSDAPEQRGTASPHPVLMQVFSRISQRWSLLRRLLFTLLYSLNILLSLRLLPIRRPVLFLLREWQMEVSISLTIIERRIIGCV